MYARLLSVLTSSTLFIHGRSDAKPWQLSYRTIDIMARKRCQWSTFNVHVKLSFGWQRAHCKTYIMPTGMINRIFPKEYFIQLCMSVNNLLHNLLYQFLIYKTDASGLLWVSCRCIWAGGILLNALHHTCSHQAPIKTGASSYNCHHQHDMKQ